MKNTFKIVFGLVLLSLAGCATSPQNSNSEAGSLAMTMSNNFIRSSHLAVAQLVNNLDVATVSPVLVATVVDINDLRQAKPLGRTLSEQYSSGMVARGFDVKEMKLRGEVFVRETTGELLLSREIKSIARVHDAATVVVGTYSVASTVVYVSLKLVRTDTGQILRAYDYTLPNDADLRALMH